ncbi:hypothetical protein J1614_005474 [Plenodomus biglobosus]|nr:hypothetical protein J1614_005474 [Plenodomus biglobosus]
MAETGHLVARESIRYLAVWLRSWQPSNTDNQDVWAVGTSVRAYEADSRAAKGRGLIGLHATWEVAVPPISSGDWKVTLSDRRQSKEGLIDVHSDPLAWDFTLAMRALR